VPPLIKDYVEFRKVEYLPSITPANLNDCIRTFLPTDGLIELLSRILESISRKIGERNKSLQEPASILLTGGYGVGKSHLLSTVFNLIGQKGAWAQGLNDPRVQSNITAIRDMDPLCIRIDLADQTNVPLPELVLAKIHSEYQSRFGKQLIDPSVIPGIGTIKAHELITFNIAAERPILLVVDGLAKRTQSRDVAALNADIEFLSFMGYSSKTARFFLIVAAHEDFFSPKSPLGIDSTLMAQTLENFKIEWIDRASVKEIIARHVFRKSPRQQQDVRKLHAFIKAKLPNFQYSENDFCDAYPFHPLIFDLAERIRSKLPTFALLDFVCSVYPKVASHRAVSLVTIENVFNRVEYDLKTDPQSQRLYATYQELAERAVPRLQDRYRLWGKMLLKATCLFTLADRNPTVRDLADALLLFEDSEGLSYNVVGMLLAQMEKAADQGFSTTDNRLDRTYRLGTADVREQLNKTVSSIASQILDSDCRLAEILPAAAADIFPDWTLRGDLTMRMLREPPIVQAFWRGTERPGCLVCSERFFPAASHGPDAPGELTSLSQELPSIHEPFLSNPPMPPADSEPPARELEWLLWMEPIGLPTAVQSALKPAKPTEIHWLPAQSSAEELVALKKALAIHLMEKSASNDFAPTDLKLLREETRSGMANLFRELYLFRGKIVTASRIQSFNQGHLECRSLRSFVSYLFKPNLDLLYSQHPDFGGEQLTVDGKFFVADRSNHRVQVWDRVEDALAGLPASASLGAADEMDRSAGLGRNKLFMPGSVAWGGGYLWVGEFKFSTRILRFSPSANAAAQRATRTRSEPPVNPSPAPQPGAGPASPRTHQPGPWDNDVLVQRLGPGQTQPLATFPRAGVPTLARLADGRLIAAFQHFPADNDRNFDRVAVSFSSDEGRTWTEPEPITVTGMEAGLARPFDPTLVPLLDGRVRIYFTSNRSPDFARSVPAIYSAVGKDGVDYEFEPGVRFALEGRVVIDCAVALHGGVFHLIVPDNGTPEQMRANQQRREPPQGGAGYHAVSKDGLNFERVADVTMPGENRWLGNMQSNGERLAFFGTGAGPWPVTSTDGVKWEAVAGSSRVPGADPGAVKLKDGAWLVAVTSPPRAGTATAGQPAQPPQGQPGPRGPRPNLMVFRLERRPLERLLRVDGACDLASLLRQDCWCNATRGEQGCQNDAVKRKSHRIHPREETELRRQTWRRQLQLRTHPYSISISRPKITRNP